MDDIVNKYYRTYSTRFGHVSSSLLGAIIISKDVESIYSDLFKLIKIHINENPDSLFITTNDGHNALMLAIKFSTEEIIQIILDVKFESDKDYNLMINMQNDSGQSALMLACKELSNTKIINKLIDAAIDLNLSDMYRNTALLLTIKESKFDYAKILIHAGANLNLINSEGYTALILLLKNTKCTKDMVQTFINVDSNINSNAIIVAIENFQPDFIIKILINACANIETKSQHMVVKIKPTGAYSTGAKSNNIQNMTLLDLYIYINYCNFANNHIVDLLINKGIKINYYLNSQFATYISNRKKILKHNNKLLQVINEFKINLIYHSDKLFASNMVTYIEKFEKKYINIYVDDDQHITFDIEQQIINTKQIIENILIEIKYHPNSDTVHQIANNFKAYKFG